MRRIRRQAKNEETEWIGCEDCKQWRVVPKGYQLDEDEFRCEMLEINCEVPQTKLEHKHIVRRYGY